MHGAAAPERCGADSHHRIGRGLRSAIRRHAGLHRPHFQLSERTLLLANPEIGTGERLAAGQVIRIPTSEPAFPSEPRTLIPYVAQAGLSLSTIASMFGVSLEELIRVNPQLGTAQDIFVGQIVWVPTVPDAPASRLPAILFMAQPGDTLGDIGLRFDVTLEEMVAANRGATPTCSPGRSWSCP